MNGDKLCMIGTIVFSLFMSHCCFAALFFQNCIGWRLFTIIVMLLNLLNAWNGAKIYHKFYTKEEEE